MPTCHGRDSGTSIVNGGVGKSRKCLSENTKDVEPRVSTKQKFSLQNQVCTQAAIWHSNGKPTKGKKRHGHRKGKDHGLIGEVKGDSVKKKIR